MRLLVTIPHYYFPLGTRANDGRRHGSTELDATPRIAALRSCIASIRQHLGPSQCVIDLTHKYVRAANTGLAVHVDIVVCTTGGRHLLDRLGLPEGHFEHRPTRAEPLLLGFECQAVLRERLGGYDLYAFMEDDLIIRDPWMLPKLSWFARYVGPDALLQPNRYEVAPDTLVLKAYVDGPLPPSFTSAYQDINDRPVLATEFLGRRIVFRRPLNPHSGCYFLTAEQLSRWVARPDFLDRDTRFVGPLESAATLGVMRAFRIYKPASEHASFLEIEHAGTEFIGRLYRKGETPPG